jgi:undecaprenyl-diphosphatase
MNKILRRLYQIDLQITQKICLKSPEHFLWKPAVYLAHSGDSWVCAILVGLLWIVTSGVWHRNLAILEISIVLQALLVFGIKRLFHRQRPEGDWGGIYRLYDPHSFPSGHATRAALLAFLALNLGPLWFAGVLLIWAPLVCISRVMTGVHYVLDIFGGVLLGLALGPILMGLMPIWMHGFPFLF